MDITGDIFNVDVLGAKISFQAVYFPEKIYTRQNGVAGFNVGLYYECAAFFCCWKKLGAGLHIIFYKSVYPYFSYMYIVWFKR